LPHGHRQINFASVNLPGDSNVTGRSQSPDSTDTKALASGLRVTWVGMAANLFLVVLKLWVGLLARSQALVADAAHSVSDLFSDLIVLLGLRWGRKAADVEHPFGHGRIETIASLLVGAALVLAALGIAWQAVNGIYSRQVSVPSLLAVYAAAASILIKEGLYRYTIVVGRRIKSMPLVANAWHHRADALSSVAVLIGVGAVYIRPDWYLADSVAALVVAFFVLKVGAKFCWTAFKELADTAPGVEVVAAITQTAGSVKGVRGVHDVRARQSGPHLLAELHLVVDKDITVLEGHTLAREAEKRLLAKISDLHSVTIHVDPDTAVDSRPRS
jgi:cation diffusion facilitator family transporter